MIKTLTRHGNSWALIIDKPILDLLKLDPETPLEVSTDGERLVIARADSDQKKSKVRQAREKVHRRYGKAFRKLAE